MADEEVIDLTFGDEDEAAAAQVAKNPPAIGGAPESAISFGDDGEDDDDQQEAQEEVVVAADDEKETAAAGEEDGDDLLGLEDIKVGSKRGAQQIYNQPEEDDPLADGNSASVKPAIAVSQQTPAASAPAQPPSKRIKIDSGNRSQVRLLKEFERACSVAEQPNSMFKVELVDENLFKWKCLMYFPADTQFHKDLAKWGKQLGQEPALVMEFNFGSDHPFSPPTVRILRPRVVRGTGYVLGEGAICVDLLTPSGWSPANRFETVLEALRSLLLTNNFEARVDFQAVRQGDYQFAAWRDSFNYLKKAHPNWQ